MKVMTAGSALHGHVTLGVGWATAHSGARGNAHGVRTATSMQCVP